MKNFRLSTIINELFKVLIIFLFCYIWTLKFINNRIWAIFATCIISLIIYGLFYCFSTRKNKKAKLKKAELEKINDITNTFIFSSDIENLNFFYKLANLRHTAIKKGKHIFITHEDGNVVLYPFFTYRNFNSDDLIMLYTKLNKTNLKRIVICTNTVDDSAIKLSERLPEDIRILNSKDTYINLLKEYNLFPEIKHGLKNVNKTTYKDLLEIGLNKKRTKGYFLASIFVLTSSFFVRYNIYYIVISSILLILAFVSFLNPKYNKPASPDIL